jgi:hypothetical protein
MSNDNGSSALVPQRQGSADVIEYDSRNARPGQNVPTLPQALTSLQEAVTGLFDDVVLEYERDRYGQTRLRFRAYRHRR